jgi:hypothetical protein
MQLLHILITFTNGLKVYNLFLHVKLPSIIWVGHYLLTLFICMPEL